MFPLHTSVLGLLTKIYINTILAFNLLDIVSYCTLLHFHAEMLGIDRMSVPGNKKSNLNRYWVKFEIVTQDPRLILALDAMKCYINLLSCLLSIYN